MSPTLTIPPFCFRWLEGCQLQQILLIRTKLGNTEGGQSPMFPRTHRGAHTMNLAPLIWMSVWFVPLFPLAKKTPLWHNVSISTPGDGKQQPFSWSVGELGVKFHTRFAQTHLLIFAGLFLCCPLQWAKSFWFPPLPCTMALPITPSSDGRQFSKNNLPP